MSIFNKQQAFYRYRNNIVKAVTLSDTQVRLPCIPKSIIQMLITILEPIYLEIINNTSVIDGYKLEQTPDLYLVTISANGGNSSIKLSNLSAYVFYNIRTGVLVILLDQYVTSRKTILCLPYKGDYYIYDIDTATARQAVEIYIDSYPDIATIRKLIRTFVQNNKEIRILKGIKYYNVVRSVPLEEILDAAKKLNLHPTSYRFNPQRKCWHVDFAEPYLKDGIDGIEIGKFSVLDELRLKVNGNHIKQIAKVFKQLRSKK